MTINTSSDKIIKKLKKKNLINSNQFINSNMKNKLFLKLFMLINIFNLPSAFAHKLPSHFADHNHESDPKFERPYIRVKNKN